MNKFLTIFAAATIVLLGALAPTPVRAWQAGNSLYKCVMEAKSTICYSAYTSVNDHTEVCQMRLIQADAQNVIGPGISFNPPVGSMSQTDPWSTCYYGFSAASAGYLGFIRPCAPGGPEGWTHYSHHFIGWKSGSTWGPDWDHYIAKDLPLPVSTCTDGDGGTGGPLP